MTFLRAMVTRYANPLENAELPLTNESLLGLLGGAPTASGAPVTPDGAMRVGAALRGTQIIAAGIAGLPLKTYAGGSATRETNKPAITGHNEYQTSFERWETVVAHMVLWGNAFLFKTRDAAGNVVRLTPIHPSRVQVDAVDSLELGGLVRRFVVDGKPWTAFEVLHIPCMSLTGVSGIGPIRAARESVGLALSAERASAKLFAQGLMLDGFLTTDAGLDQKQANALKRKWRRTLQGAEHAGDVGILDSGAKFQSLTMPFKDAQFLESRKFQVTEIARLLGLPGWMLNDQEKSTSWGTGMEQQFRTFVTLTLKPYMQRIEQRVTAELLYGAQYAEFVVEGLLRGDSAARAAFYASGIVNHWMVPNEARAKENLPPLPGGDEPFSPNTTGAQAKTEQDSADGGNAA
ncbi:MAG: phage portal protein [Nocardioidaceae bacterium]